MRLRGIGAEAFSLVLFMFRRVPIEPVDALSPYECEDVRRQAIEEPPVPAHDNRAARERVQQIAEL
jgi:hypothetical protein